MEEAERDGDGVEEDVGGGEEEEEEGGRDCRTNKAIRPNNEGKIAF